MPTQKPSIPQPTPPRTTKTQPTQNITPRRTKPPKPVVFKDFASI